MTTLPIPIQIGPNVTHRFIPNNIGLKFVMGQVFVYPIVDMRSKKCLARMYWLCEGEGIMRLIKISIAGEPYTIESPPGPLLVLVDNGRKIIQADKLRIEYNETEMLVVSRKFEDFIVSGRLTKKEDINMALIIIPHAWWELGLGTTTSK